MVIQDYKLEKMNGELYDVILYIRANGALEEFAEEFGNLTRETEKDINRLAISYVKMKFSNIKVRSIKVMMGGALVTTVMFSGGMTQAFANEHEGEVQDETTTETTAVNNTVETDPNTETEAGTTTLEEPAGETSPTDEGATTTPTENEPATEPTPEEPVTDGGVAEETTADEPTLLPGDFFYFVKTLSEKISLALTFDDTEKAQKLANFAAERIAEANALLEREDTEGAAETLQKALENQELALDYSEKVDEETGTADGDVTTDAVSEVRKTFEEQIAANTMALLLAMEKVDNPNAKEALAKNVEKSFERMSKKLEKINDIKEKIQEKIAKGELDGVEDFKDEINDLEDEIEEDQEEFEEEMEEVEEKSKGAIAKGKDRDKEIDDEDRRIAPTANKKAEKKEERKKENLKSTEEKDDEDDDDEEEVVRKETKREEVKRESPKKQEPKGEIEEESEEEEDKGDE